MATWQQEWEAQCERDLRWFLHHGESVMGLRSSFGPLVDLALGGFGGGGESESRATDRRHGWSSAARIEGAVAIARRLRARWQQLPADAQQVLWLAHGPHAWTNWSKDVNRVLGTLSGVALLTAAAHAAWRASTATGKRPPSAPQWRQEHDQRDTVTRCTRGPMAERAKVTKAMRCPPGTALCEVTSVGSGRGLCVVEELEAGPTCARSRRWLELVWVRDVSRAAADTSTSEPDPVAAWLVSQCTRHRNVDAIKNEAERLVRGAFAEWLVISGGLPKRPRRLAAAKPRPAPLPVRGEIVLPYINPEAD